MPIDTGPPGNQQSISGNLSSATHYIPADVSSANPSEQLGVALGLAVQLPHPKTQVSTRRHSDHQAISSTSSNTFMVNQVNNDLHSNRREPSPYQDTTFSTQYPGLNGGAVGAPDNLSTHNRYISFPNVSAQPHYPGDPYPSECPLYNSHNMTNTSEQPELTPAYDRGLVLPQATPSILQTCLSLRPRTRVALWPLRVTIVTSHPPLTPASFPLRVTTVTHPSLMTAWVLLRATPSILQTYLCNRDLHEKQTNP